jgi:hypothetical protein
MNDRTYYVFAVLLGISITLLCSLCTGMILGTA